eukprot:COSAG01_NODE_29761_length_630_cov_0.977401_1_plen_133_part_10
MRAYARASVLSDALEQIASTIHGQSPRALLRSREQVLRVTEVSESGGVMEVLCSRAASTFDNHGAPITPLCWAVLTKALRNRRPSIGRSTGGVAAHRPRRCIVYLMSILYRVSNEHMHAVAPGSSSVACAARR